MTKGFFKSGHTPTLFSAFLYFEISFMVWVILGSLGVYIAGDLGLGPAQKGLMVAIPVLSGALLRIPAGILSDRIGPRKTGQWGQIAVILVLSLAWFLGLDHVETVYLVGVLLGVAGASFAVALPLVSRWYPPERQGLALGLVGAGNSGTVLAALFAPRLAEAFGWQAVIGLAAVPSIITLIVYSLMAEDAPEFKAAGPRPQNLQALRETDAWWLCLFYMVAFGGFVGLASSLLIYFNDQYGLSPVIAGNLTALCVFAGSMARPLGGALADRIGGVKTLQGLYAVIALSMFVIGLEPASPYMALLVFVVGMCGMGMGTGAVFQLVPLRFRNEIGTMTGIVGTAGGIGGFFLASLLGYSKEWTGSYQLGFITFANLAMACLIGILVVETKWKSLWKTAAAGAKV
ncbi:MAG: nitrate/nitrite transporter [Nitrospinales bacterium]